MPTGIYKRIKPPWNKGKHWSLDVREKMSKAREGKYLGANNFFFGKRHSNETKNSISKSLIKNPVKHWLGKKRPRGKDNPKWKGGYQYKLLLNNKRRIKKSGNGGQHTLSEWEALKMKYSYMCLCCKRVEPVISLTRDHIVPVIKGGTDNIENIQPLCRGCNSRKHTNIIKYQI